MYGVSNDTAINAPPTLYSVSYIPKPLKLSKDQIIRIRTPLTGLKKIYCSTKLILTDKIMLTLWHWRWTHQPVGDSGSGLCGKVSVEEGSLLYPGSVPGWIHGIRPSIRCLSRWVLYTIPIIYIWKIASISFPFMSYRKLACGSEPAPVVKKIEIGEEFCVTSKHSKEWSQQHTSNNNLLLYVRLL